MVKTSEVFEVASDMPAFTSVDEFVGDFVVVETREVFEATDDRLALIGVDELMSDTSIEVGKASEVASD